MKLLFLILYLAGLASLQAQNIEYPHDFYDYGLVNKPANNIISYAPKARLGSLMPLLEAVALSGDASFGILHIGDSHIQADYMTDRLRDLFMLSFPGADAGRGFVFPYSMAGTNNPQNYAVSYTGKWQHCRNIEKSLSCDIGIAGATVHTETPNARICISQPGGENRVYGFDRVKVFCSMDAAAFEPRLIAPRGVGVQSRANAELGYVEFFLSSFIDTLVLEFSQFSMSQTSTSFYGASLESSLPGITYSATGINGADVQAWLRCNLLEKHIAALRPDIVVVSLGANDSHVEKFDCQLFSSNYSQLIGRIYQAQPSALIVLTTPGDNYYRRLAHNPNTAIAAYEIAKLARKHRCLLWDYYTVMGGGNSIAAWDSAGLSAADKLHYTKLGYRVQAEMFFSAFMKLFDNYASKDAGAKPISNY
jgi:lysophospholipase L1-like esterase